MSLVGLLKVAGAVVRRNSLVVERWNHNPDAGVRSPLAPLFNSMVAKYKPLS
jgi:hypothetical protein